MEKNDEKMDDFDDNKKLKRKKTDVKQAKENKNIKKHSKNKQNVRNIKFGSDEFEFQEDPILSDRDFRHNFNVSPQKYVVIDAKSIRQDEKFNQIHETRRAKRRRKRHLYDKYKNFKTNKIEWEKINNPQIYDRTIYEFDSLDDNYKDTDFDEHDNKKKTEKNKYFRLIVHKRNPETGKIEAHETNVPFLGHSLPPDVPQYRVYQIDQQTLRPLQPQIKYHFFKPLDDIKINTKKLNNNNNKTNNNVNEDKDINKDANKANNEEEMNENDLESDFASSSSFCNENENYSEKQQKEKVYFKYVNANDTVYNPQTKQYDPIKVKEPKYVQKQIKQKKIKKYPPLFEHPKNKNKNTNKKKDSDNSTDDEMVENECKKYSIYIKDKNPKIDKFIYSEKEMIQMYGTANPELKSKFEEKETKNQPKKSFVPKLKPVPPPKTIVYQDEYYRESIEDGIVTRVRCRDDGCPIVFSSFVKPTHHKGDDDVSIIFHSQQVKQQQKNKNGTKQDQNNEKIPQQVLGHVPVHEKAHFNDAIEEFSDEDDAISVFQRNISKQNAEEVKKKKKRKRMKSVEPKLNEKDEEVISFARKKKKILRRKSSVGRPPDSALPNAIKPEKNKTKTKQKQKTIPILPQKKLSSLSSEERPSIIDLNPNKNDTSKEITAPTFEIPIEPQQEKQEKQKEQTQQQPQTKKSRQRSKSLRSSTRKSPSFEPIITLAKPIKFNLDPTGSDYSSSSSSNSSSSSDLPPKKGITKVIVPPMPSSKKNSNASELMKQEMKTSVFFAGSGSEKYPVVATDFQL